MATKKKSTKAQKKVGRVMHEYKHGELHTGSKKGPKVKNRKQAIAIGLSEARRAGASVPPKKGSKKAASKKATKKSSSKKSSTKKSTKKSSRKATKK